MRGRKIPFSIDRSDWRSVVEQLKDGVREAIVSGYYRPGDTLPSYRELAPLLDVSEIVTKAAIKQLAAEGLVSARPRIGTVVRDLGEKRWKGRVLLVTRSDGCGYYDNVFASVLRGLLANDGWLCTPISVKRSSRAGCADLSELKVMIAHPANLAIVLFGNPAAEALLSEAGIPFVVMGDKKACRLRGCVGCIHYKRAAAGAQFTEACRTAGVKRVMQIGVAEMDDVRNALREAGIVCESLIINEPRRTLTLDFFSEAGRDATAKFLKSGRALPDAFYFTDDYICAGALAALSDAGIRAPQDVRVATWANYGNVPVYARPLSRIEIDPWKNAEATYAFCRGVLTGKRGAKPPVLAPTWVSGGTMGGAKREPCAEQFLNLGKGKKK